ncbi:penicillin-binding protein activator [Vibrio sp. NTOU-M3]|uniref:penicillin-binding protein activator n=1 Tax=Vibrio sp. NTOU-M3 TaxID=3234954 RepID=UPI00349FCCD8
MANKNHKRLSVTRILTPVALAVTLAACSSKPSAPTSVDITLDPSQSTQSYLMRADASQGSLQNDWLIMALKSAIAENDDVQAQLLLKRLARQPLSEPQQAEWQLARAQLLVNQSDYSDALSGLNFNPGWMLEDEQWRDYHNLRAKLFAKKGDYFEASRELIALSSYLASSQQNYVAQDVWANLNRYSANEITRFSAQPEEAVLDGWLQLTTYVKAMSNNIPQLKNTLEKWLAENPNHPAALYTPKSLQNILSLEITKPVNTALLLPLTGKFAKQAQLIRDGFILEMMNDEQRDPSATLTVVDTNTITVEELERTLLEKNIDFIVGPLIKDDVEKLQAAQDKFAQPVPMLALNIPDEIENGTSTCYLALSPEQEVEQAAKHLYEQGYKYPLILAPKGHLGERVVSAFNREWQQHSENKVAVTLFSDKRQLQRNINSAFGLQGSQQHIAQMESLLGISLETQPRSRRDVDAVYIVASSAELTLIKPFIEVAINPDTAPPKLFSNSRSNNGRHQYEDLSGVVYSDIPLLIHPEEQLKRQMDEMWPNESNSQKRLQALGMDAYLMMEQLPQMKVVDGYTVKGRTGVLSINEQCVVEREIDWAEHSAQ